jgi:acyl-CoA synthetase (AMP-forming)/AMP-acid ligase II
MMGPNLVSELLAGADTAPQRVAIAVTRERDPDAAESVTFEQLREHVERLACGLRRAGLGPGDRIVLATPASVSFYALALAVLGSGAAVVLIDGALDRRRLLSALRSSRARAIVSVDSALRRWPLTPPLIRMRRYAVDRPRVGVRPLSELFDGRDQASFIDSAPDDSGLISFTSGTSGRAKGANRTQAILRAQHGALSRHLPYSDGDVDMPCFPAAVLHNLACGVTSVLPPVDLRRPASIQPGSAIAAIRRFNVTTLSGAPAYLERIATHLIASHQSPPPVRRVLVGGAPVNRRLASRLLDAFPSADVRIVYGSTEAEPIAHIEAREVVDSLGEGILVGPPVPEIDLKLVVLPERIDRPLARSELERSEKSVGEIIASGAHVNRQYIGDPSANARNKIHERGGLVWHRTGDIARYDDVGRIWLLGRTGDAVRHRGHQLHPLALEASVSELRGVRAAALVAHDRAPEGELAVIADPAALAAARALLAQAGLSTLRVRPVTHIPTDPRHNSKIDRATLRAQLAHGGAPRAAKPDREHF